MMKKERENRHEGFGHQAEAKRWTYLKGFQLSEPTYCPVVTVTNEKEIKGDTVRVHKSVMEHIEARMEKTGTSQYKINPEIMKAGDLVFVGSLDNELDTETKKFKDLLGF